MISDHDKKVVRETPASLMAVIQLDRHASDNPNDSDLGFLRDPKSRDHLKRYAYRMYNFALTELQDHCDKWGYSLSERSDIRSNSWNRSKETDTRLDIIDKISGDAASHDIRMAMNAYAERLLSAVQDYREDARKGRDDYEPMTKHYTDSRRVAERELEDTFPRSYWRVTCDGSPIRVEPRPAKLRYEKNEVNVSPAWYKQVAERGISVVKDPKLRHVFVLQAKKREVLRLKESNISAYKARVVCSRDGVAEVHERWLAVQEGVDAPVVGIGRTLPDAEALLKRRTKTAVLDELLDEL